MITDNNICTYLFIDVDHIMWSNTEFNVFYQTICN